MSKTADQGVPASTTSIASHGEVIEIDADLEKTVVRKIDCVVLPLMCLVYFFQCMHS